MGQLTTISEVETQARKWERWTEQVRLTHYDRADRYRQWNILIGALAIILTTVVSAGILSSIHTKPTFRWKVAAAVVGVFAAALAALGSYLNLGSLSEQHRQTAASFGKVRRQLELLALAHPPDDTQSRAELESLAFEIADLEKSGPGYPARAFERSQAELVPEGLDDRETQAA